MAIFAVGVLTQLLTMKELRAPGIRMVAALKVYGLALLFWLPLLAFDLWVTP